MVTSLDAVLLLSNSGETNELKDLVYYAKRHGIGLIAMVGSADSTFAKASDVALVLPSQPEASPLHAPTSSTAMMLALGDALAVVLHERRGFSAEDFSQLHPGGKLGMVLKHVKTVMHRGDALPLVLSGTLIRDALFEMSSKRLGCVAVTDEDGRLMGVVTDGDLRRHMSDDLLQKTVDAVMTSTPKTIESDRLLAEALDRMEQHGITLLLVTDARGYLEGILHVHDCLRLGVA
jgi:arabinose-5-phosphate isomerase